MDPSLEPCVYDFGPFCLDPINKSLTFKGRALKIQRKQVDTLLLLVSNGGQLITREDFQKQIWGLNVNNKSLSWQISMLRKILGDGGPKYRYIQTVPTFGYKFVAKVVPRNQGRAKSRPKLSLTHGDKGNPVKPSIAVLPFKVLGRGSRDKYLQLGMAFSITSKLSSLRELSVRQTAAVLRGFPGKSDPLAVGQKLRVDWLLEGEIHSSGDSMFITVQLTNLRQMKVTWKQRFEETHSDPFAVQDLISEEVAKRLLPKLSPKNTRLLNKRSTESMQAYQLYINGRSYWNQRTNTGLLRAIEYFNLAIGADPEYARAYAGLADCYNLLSYYSGLPPEKVFPKAMAFAEKALQIDKTLAEAHTSRSYAVSRYYWEWKEAEQGYKRAIKLNASYPSAHQWYAEHLTAMGRFEEAKAEVEQARRLDPLSPVIAAAVGTVHYFARSYNQAIEHYRKAIEERPDFVRTRFRLARAYVQKEMFGEAIKECKKGLILSPGKTKEIVQLGQAYAMAKQFAQAKKIIKQLERLSKSSYVSEYNVAIIYVGLEDLPEAFRWLEKAFLSHDPWLEHLNVDPRLDDLRGETRFRELLRRLDLLR